MMLKATLQRAESNTEEGQDGGFCGAGLVLFLDFSAGHMGEFALWNSCGLDKLLCAVRQWKAYLK